jgi:hypothetical protein
MSLQIPTTPFDPAATIIARKSFVTFTPADAQGEVLNIVCQKIEIDASVDYVENAVPTGKYIMTNRKVPKTLNFEVKAELTDVKTVIEYFGALPFSGRGTAEVFVCDPDDATGVVAVHLKPFPCEFSSDGSLTFEGENFTKINIIIEALAEVEVLIDDAGPEEN